ncbi:MAG: choice-of-anchor L domain-containing protein [Flavobacteriaceae bacterium]
MKNKLTIIALLFSGLLAHAQLLEINNPNNSTEADYSLQQLIENVLITGACAQVDTFSEQVHGTATDTQNKSYGFFKRPAGNSFPFEEGIVLTTGEAYPAGNTATTTNISNQNGQGGDADLATALGQSGLQDATFIKFTFVPTSTSISFRFIMASEEYDGSTECNYADSFAFLLRKEGTTTYTNLAVLPSGTPVSVLNINNANACSANTEYFEGYNVGNTNYGGRTKALTATSAVIPNERYEIKLVVSDQGDSAWDSAIFLEAGSFVLGASLGNPRITADNNAACGNDVLLDAGIVATSYKWYKDNVEIVGELNQTYLANLGNGLYKVEVDLGAGCIGEDEIAVEFVTDATINNAITNLYECDTDNDGTSTFNLQDKDVEILNGQLATEFEVVYYLDSAYTILVPTPTAFDSTGQTVYARVQNSSSTNCYADGAFEIIITQAVAEISANIPKIDACDDTSFGTTIDGQNSFDLEQNKTIILNGSSNTDFSLTYFTDAGYNNQIPNATINSYTNTSAIQTIYVQMTNNLNANCFDRTSFQIEVFANPVLNAITIKQCDDDTDGFSNIDLTLSNANISANSANEAFLFFTTQALANANSNPIAIPTNFNTNSNTIWVRVENANGCTTIEQVTIIVSATSTAYNTTLYKCDDFINTLEDDYDGITEFDLTQVETDVLNLFPATIQPDLSITYYKNINDAQLQANVITTPATYRNSTITNERIYIRVNNNTNFDCAGLGVDLYVDLVVEGLPILTQPTDKIECGDINNQFSFDTTGIINEVLGIQTGVTLSFYDENDVLIPTTTFFPNYLSGTQTVTIRAINNTTNDPNGACNKETTMEFIVDITPIANAVPIQQLCDDLPNITDGLSTFDTALIESTLLGGTQTDTEVHYYTNYYDATLKAEILPSLPEFFTSATQVVTAEVINTNNASCIATTDIQFLVAPDAPIFDVSDQLLCLDLLPTPLSVSIENPLAVYDYYWENDKGEQIGSNIDTIEITEAGDYTVTATSSSMCDTTKAFTVHESSIPVIETITIFDDLPNNHVSVLVSGAGDYEFSLDDGDYTDGNEIYGHVFYNVEEGAHIININDKNGCTPIVSKEIIIIRFPRFITPNHDGINDTFSVYGGDAFVTSNVVLFDRYGKVIANLDNNESWDGTFSGKIASETDYWFVATFTDSLGKEYERKGHFSLKQ